VLTLGQKDSSKQTMCCPAMPPNKNCHAINANTSALARLIASEGRRVMPLALPIYTAFEFRNSPGYVPTAHFATNGASELVVLGKISRAAMLSGANLCLSACFCDFQLRPSHRTQTPEVAVLLALLHLLPCLANSRPDSP